MNPFQALYGGVPPHIVQFCHRQTSVEQCGPIIVIVRAHVKTCIKWALDSQRMNKI